MPQGQTRSLLRHVHQLLGTHSKSRTEDAELLRRFVTLRDEAALTALIERHARLVWSVCRRILRNEQDAEDAFQATLLVFLRKAASIRKSQSVGSRLHGVALRVARRARDHRCRQGNAMSAETAIVAKPSTDIAWRELQSMLDEELQRLPARYRAPFIACCLEGKSRQETAEELGWKLGTVSSRLARARQLLQARLARRGVTLGAVLTGLALGSDATAGLPAGAVASLAASLVTVARGRPAARLFPARVVTLAETAMRAASLMKVAMAGGVAVLLLTLAAGAGLSLGPLTADPPGGPVAQHHPDKPKSSLVETSETEAREVRTDNLGDSLPPGAVARMGTERLRHGSSIWSVRFSPDGSSVVSSGGSFDPTVRFWDLHTGAERRRLQVLPGPPNGVLGDVMALDIASDGKLAASGTAGLWNRVDLWDLATGKRLRSCDGHSKGIIAVAFSPDGKIVASASYDHSIRLWDVATGAETRCVDGHQGAVYSVRFSPDGATLASGSGDKTVRIWDAASGKELSVLRGHHGSVLSVAFTRDGTRLASGSSDKTARIWDAASGKELCQFKEPSEGVSGVAFSPDGSLLATASRNGWVRLWDSAAGQERGRLPVSLDFSSLAFSHHGETLAAGCHAGCLYLWDVAHNKELLPFEGHRGRILSALYSPDGTRLASGGMDGTIRLSDPRTGKQLRVLADGLSWVKELAFSPDGRTLAAADYTPVFILRDAASGRSLQSFVGHEGEVHCVAFSPDGHLVASGADDKTARLWDAATGRELHVFKEPKAEIRAVAFSPDSRVLAVGGGYKDGAVYLLDVATGNELRRFAAHASVDSLHFTPDGRAMVSTCYDRNIAVWETATGKELKRFGDPGRGGFGYSQSSLSTDGRFLLTGADHLLRIWEVATGQPVLDYLDRNGGSTVAFAPDGRTVAAGSSSLLIWDASGRNAARNPAKKFSPEELEALWNDLGSADAPTAYRALWDFVAVPEVSVPFLRRKLPPVAIPDPELVKRLIAELDSDRFAVREKAANELRRLGSEAEPALRKLAAKRPSSELGRQVERLLNGLDSESLRRPRVLAILERIGSPEACDLLANLAAGAPGATLTAEAKASFERAKRLLKAAK